MTRLLGGSLGLGLVLAASGVSAQGAKEDVPLPPLDVLGERPPEYRSTAPGSIKLPEHVKDVPQSITIVPEQVIEDQAITTLRDALRNVTGISLQAGEGGGPQGDNLTLRGYSARTDIFVDGIRDAGQYTRDVFNLEAVEVLKGPSAVFFGRGSTGGAINQVSKTPKPNAFRELSVSGTSGPGARVTADVNQPIGSTMALRLNGMFTYTEPVDRDEVDYERWGIAPSFTWGLGTATSVTLSYLFQKEDNLPDYGIPVLLGEPAPVDRSNFYGLKDHDFEKTETHLVTASLDHRFDEHVSLHTAFRYGHYDREARVTPPRILGMPTPATPLEAIEVRRNRPGRDTEETITAAQGDLLFTFDTWGIGHRLVTGLDLSRQTFDQTAIVSSPITITSLLDPDPDPDVDIVETRGARTDATALALGVYVIDEVQLLRWLKVMGGFRYDVFDADLDSYDETGALTASRSRTDTMLAPRAAIIVQPTPAQTYYFSYGESFNPSAEQLSTINAANEDLEPEKNRSFEVGAKWELLDGALGLNAAVFRIEKTNARTPDPDDPALQVLAGNTRADGFEVGVTGRLLPGWQVFAGYTWLDTRIVEAGDGTEGNRLANSPEHTVSLWTTYDFLGSWQVGTGVIYVGERFANNQNTSEVPDYVRWDATVAHQLTKNIELRLNVINILDETYFDRIHPGHVVPGDGRTFVVGAHFRY